MLTHTYIKSSKFRVSRCFFNFSIKFLIFFRINSFLEILNDKTTKLLSSFFEFKSSKFRNIYIYIFLIGSKRREKRISKKGLEGGRRNMYIYIILSFFIFLNTTSLTIVTLLLSRMQKLLQEKREEKPNLLVSGE